MLKPWKATYSHEDLFLQRYEWLLNWALQLTGRNHEQAEDLVHDAFIQFTLSRPDLDSIQNLEGYLYGMLRNMHLSQVRRAARIHNRPLSIIDYDSAEIGLRTTDLRNQMQARDELRAVCAYACARKEKSRAGSVLLLRFFHGYYPSEISRVLQSPRRAADDWLRIARREAKIYLDDPPRLRLVESSSTAIHNYLSGPAADFLGELRSAIFRSRCGHCLSSEQLQELYRSTEAGAIDCPTLAHIVSCPLCLDNVNKLLGLPCLSDRFPTDTIGPDTHSKAGSSGSRGTQPDVKTAGHLKHCRRRAREVFEHSPKELRISVNGFILGSQSLGSELNEQTLNVSMTENIGFVEVFSEQGIRLLLLNAEPPPDGPVDQPASIELSEGRTLELTLSFNAPWPRLHAVYHDPSLKAVSPLKEASLKDAAADPENRKEHRESPIVKPLRLMPQLRRRFGGLGSLLSPARVTAILAVLLILISLLVRTRGPSASAAELLRRASDSEEASAAKSDLTAHCILNLEERNRADGTLIARRRIEVWLSAAKGRKARRVYDENNQLIAAEWTSSDGSRLVYDRDAKPQLQQAPERRVGALVESGAVWQLELSARDFSSVIGRTDMAAVHDRGDAYVIDYQSTTTADASRLLRATIKLSKTDLHPVEQTLLVRQNGRDVEYQFTEHGFERVPPVKVSPSTFEVDPELLGRRAKPLEMSGRETPELSPNSTSGPEPLSAAAFAELKVDALYELHKVGACTREQATLTRTAKGELQIQAIVDNERRKQEILEALSAVMTATAMKAEIRTVAEAISQARKLSPGPAIARRVEFTKDRIPVYADLQRYFSERAELDASLSRGRPSSARIEEDIRQMANRALALSRQALLQAWALKHHAEEISRDELGVLTPEALTKWHSMIRQHSLTFQQQTRGLRVELGPVFFSEASSDEGRDDVEADDGSDMARALERIFNLASTHEEAIRKAFAISAENPTTLDIRTEQFWRSLRRAERLASRIRTQ